MLRTLQTGRDPRTLPDYKALRDELSKLTHPARPDVHWSVAEKHCLSLFKSNGAELQTVAWYTLIRLELAGATGLSEGLALAETLLRHHWATLWPESMQVRTEILSTLCLRLQQRLRRLSPGRDDCYELRQAEQLLAVIEAVIANQALRPVNHLAALRTLLQSQAAGLASKGPAPGRTFAPETSPVSTRPDVCSVPARPENTQSANMPVPENVSCQVVVAERQTEVPASAFPLRLRARYIAVGMSVMLFVNASAVMVWQQIQHAEPLQAQYAAQLAPLPSSLTAEQLNLLRKQSGAAEPPLTQLEQQLERLKALPPDWNLMYSLQLLDQARALWPVQTDPLLSRWERELSASGLPAAQRDAWHQGMMHLSQLSERLDVANGKKGNYITVSELKSAVYNITRAFARSIPAEEQLRQLSQHAAGEPLSAAVVAQLEMHLRQLSAEYAELKLQSP